MTQAKTKVSKMHTIFEVLQGDIQLENWNVAVKHTFIGP